MPDERALRDVNRIVTLLLVDDTGEIVQAKADSTTDRLKVNTTITGDITIADTLYNGHKTVSAAGTAEALASSTSIKSVTVKALRTNTGTIYVGDSSVSSSNGFEIDPGESVDIEIDDLATVYIDADTNGDGVSYIAVGSA